MIPYRVRLVRADVGTEVPVALLTGLLGPLGECNLRALRLRIEGRSSRRGPVPQWLREASSFNIVGISAGSVTLHCEAAPLRQMLPPAVLGLLAPAFADRPCVALFVESLLAALSGVEDPILYDGDLLATIESFSGVFSQAVEQIELLHEPNAGEAAAVLRGDDIEKIARLRQRLVERAEVNMDLTGHLIRIDLNRRVIALRPDAGVPVDVLVDELLVDYLSPLLGQRVTVSGRAITGAGGVIRRFSADSIQPTPVAHELSGVDSGKRARLSRIDVAGFKSISHVQRLDLGPLNVLIGANGAGKSNFISFFRLLNAMALSGDGLASHVARSGGAGSMLHDGAAVTPSIAASMTFEGETGAIDYSFQLVHGAPDALIFSEERYRFTPSSSPGIEAPWVSLGSGHRESSLHRISDATARALLSSLRRLIVHQFHDTSDTARIKQRSAVSDGQFLKSDAANLAPFLLRLQESRHDSYARIVETIRQIVPFFEDFFLEPIQGSVLLQWRERGSGVIFHPQQASDGMLRLVALVALLLQPYDALPSLLIVDEPELGLHPYAVNVIAGLFRSVSIHTQVVLATQSVAFLDHFAPEETVVVDRPSRESRFTRLDTGALQEWLEDYSLGELWEKNVIGGRPSR